MKKHGETIVKVSAPFCDDRFCNGLFSVSAATKTGFGHSERENLSYINKDGSKQERLAGT